MTRVVPALLAAFVALAVPSRAEPAGDGIAWEKSFDQALKQARATGRPVMADFWADWCHWCELLDTTTYVDPAVVELSRKFVPVKVNTEGSLADRELTFEYGFDDLPTVAFFSPQGRLLLRLGHYQGPEDFPATLHAALEVAERVMAWEGALDEKDAGGRAEALAALGAHLFEQHRLDESRKLLEKAGKLDGGRPASERKRSRVLQGRIRLEQGKAKDARRLAQEALDLEPAVASEDAGALLLLGDAWLADGDGESARASWLRVLETDPEGPAAERARAALDAAS